jgi:uncharacterized protein (TIGR02757 family)
MKRAHRVLFKNRQRLEELYISYNHRSYVHPDPLEFLYAYPDILERELVGLVSSSLAYGRVMQILNSVASILERMGESPRYFLLNTSEGRLFNLFADFRHRFTTGKEMASMLLGAKRILERHGSIYKCFMAGLNEDQENILPALSYLVDQLNGYEPSSKNSLLPLPQRGSACKRLNLFLRWMVRRDMVDPGGWSEVPLSKLIIPLDTHMHKICLRLKITNRKQADMRTAIEITNAFRDLSPRDPVRYDFALTRLGIRKEADLEQFLRQCTLP